MVTYSLAITVACFWLLKLLEIRYWIWGQDVNIS